MNTVIFYDTETTGLPIWKEPSESENQPHIVQLGAILADADSREVIQRLDVIIKPEGWVIPEEATETHGITNELATTVGVSEADAVALFLQMQHGALRVAHNKTFDHRIVRIATKRFSDFSKETEEAWALKERHDCTMAMSKPILELPPRGRFGFKAPKLTEAYEFFTGKQLENAHTAMADAEACMAVYWGVKDHLANAA
tara:strand:+ start:725 stop:1324 length:600 start_codon:yes stop_codon:yes gene_type:complete